MAISKTQLAQKPRNLEWPERQLKYSLELVPLWHGSGGLQSLLEDARRPPVPWITMSFIDFFISLAFFFLNVINTSLKI